MASRDLVFIANILLDCDEMSDKGVHLFNYIQDKCHKYGIPEAQNEIIQIVSRYHMVTSRGEVK